MPAKHSPPAYSQYGLKDKNAKSADVYANRPGGEQREVGPADAVDASGHRLGAIEERPMEKPSSRMGQEASAEKDPKTR